MIIIHFLNILKLLVQLVEKCSTFEKKSQIIAIFACGGQFGRVFYALNYFNHCPITGKLIMCHDTFYFESILVTTG